MGIRIPPLEQGNGWARSDGREHAKMFAGNPVISMSGTLQFHGQEPVTLSGTLQLLTSRHEVSLPSPEPTTERSRSCWRVADIEITLG